MDTSHIQTNKVSSESGIKVGFDTAPVKVIEFINVRCRYCRQWFNDSRELLDTYTAEGKIQRIIKLLDKSKPGLDKGNTMHQYVNKSSQALASLSAIYDSQDLWGELDNPEEIADFAETHLKLSLDADSTTRDGVIQEANDAGIVFVPTIIVNDHIFDQHISQADLKKLLDHP